MQNERLEADALGLRLTAGNQSSVVGWLRPLAAAALSGATLGLKTPELRCGQIQQYNYNLNPAVSMLRPTPYVLRLAQRTSKDAALRVAVLPVHLPQ